MKDKEPYIPKDIEPKWQKVWAETETYKADFDSAKPKYYGFAMFNYPSGAGIHVGHVRNYTIPDVVTRTKRQQGFETYQPVGWDSFGLPAENFAIKTGISPQDSIKKAIEKYREQYRAMGWAVDWSKEIDTTDPSYYKWTQWIFLQLFKHGLAYQKESPQWWCDKCKTVLADEQVIAGKCWRHDSADDPFVTKKNLKQWFFKITDYADEILEATDALDWTPSVKASQKSWIGRSEGALVKFALDASDASLEVYTTRPDTLYGATFLVVAPEHPILNVITTEAQKTEVDSYVATAVAKTDVERLEGKHKTGVFTGAYALNPANNEKLPIWVADYVMMGYGTGAIMAVPAHDQRDFEFARKFELPVKQVIIPCADDTNNPPRPEFKEVVRDTVIVHLQDKSTGKFALLDWHGSLEGITTAIMGGIEPGQTAEEAVLAEIAEEAGLTGVTITKKLRWVTAARYCASHKQENRCAIAQVFLAEVDNLAGQAEVAEYETKTHTLVWVDKDKVLSSLVPDHQKQVWQQLQEETAITGDGTLVNSGELDGMSIAEATKTIVAQLEQASTGKPQVQYKMRDWLISRQRYWGAPIPVVHCDKCGTVAVAEKDLPVVLPEIEHFQPTGGDVSVLAGVDEWVNVECPECGGKAKRETDTMDGYVCSSWYFLRYLSPDNAVEAWSKAATDKWMPADFYNGGDHATAHLLYARFFTRFFHKLGLLSDPEPFKKMLYNGKVRASDGSAFSKTLGNGVDPLEVIEQGYGADALRLYEMFAAPLEQNVLWDVQGIPGANRFLNRVWALVQEYIESTQTVTDGAVELAALKQAHKTTKKVTHDIEDYKFNTAIAAIMEAVNGYYKLKDKHGLSKSEAWQYAIEGLVQLLAPFAPHIAEELWSQLGHTDSVHVGHWPAYDASLVKDDMITIVVQVNGKLRGEFLAAAGTANDELESEARKLVAEKSLFDGEPKKVIVVPNKLVNFVV